MEVLILNIIKYFADNNITQKAADLFCHEMNIKYDCNSQPSSKTDADFCFIIDDSCKNDDFVIEKNNNQYIAIIISQTLLDYLEILPLKHLKREKI